MFTLKFSTDNAAFTENPNEEIARILKRVADKITNYQTEGFILDINGNKIGKFKLTER